MIIYNKNSSFREWYDYYKTDIVHMFHILLKWLNDEELTVYGTREQFYRNFVHFVYKNSVSYIYK